METEEFTKAYYIKLGKGGKWEESSIRENKVRIGWLDWALEEINQGNWKSLKDNHYKEYTSKGAATMDINALKTIVESTPDDIWITFHASQLWWGRLANGKVQKDAESKYRLLAGVWQNRDVSGNPLLVNQIPGNISMVQGFRATVCKVSDIDSLKRLINNVPSDDYTKIAQARNALIEEIKKGLKKLYWKDFENLIDLLFRNAGWRRLSLVGEQMKYADMELEEPITGELYQVQVKSEATLDDFDEYARNFSHGSFRKLFFVVHSPKGKLINYRADKYENVELVLPDKLARMVVEFGLTEWLLKKIK